MPRQCISLLATHSSAIVGNLGVWGVEPYWSPVDLRMTGRISLTQSMGITVIKGCWVEVEGGVNKQRRKVSISCK